MMERITPYLIYTALILAALFLQAEIFPYLQIFGAKPDLLMILVVFAAIHTDWKSGLIVGLMAGFWLDLLLGTYFGLNMIVYGLVGALLGYTRKFTDLTMYALSFFAVLAATAFGSLLLMILLNLVGASLPVGQTLRGIIAPMVFYNLLLVILAMPVVFFRRRRAGIKIASIDLLGGGVQLTRNEQPYHSGHPTPPKARKRRAPHRGQSHYEATRANPAPIPESQNPQNNEADTQVHHTSHRRNTSRHSRNRYRRK